MADRTYRAFQVACPKLTDSYLQWIPRKKTARVTNSRSFSIAPNVGQSVGAVSGGRVDVTPLRAHQHEFKVFKNTLRAVSKGKKNCTKTFTLRTAVITSSDCPKKIIKAQLKQEIVPDIHALAKFCLN